MLKHLRQLFSSGKPNPAASPATPSEAPEVRADSATKAVKGSGDVPDIFVCREAILGRDQRIVGYEFGHSQRVQSRLMNRAAVRRFYDDALLGNLSALGSDALLGTRNCIIELSPASLLHPALAKLPKRNLTLLLSLADSPESVDLPSIHAALSALREQGVMLGLRWRRQCVVPEWMPDLDIVYLPLREYFGVAGDAPVRESAAQELSRLAGELRQSEPGTSGDGGAAPSLRLIAGELSMPADFSLCYRAGFDFFQGAFINRRDDWKPPKSSINRLRVMQLMNDIRLNAETQRLVQELKNDPTLSYRLLRYCNSPALGLQHRIDTLDQALVALGRDNIYRWLSLLLFHMVDPGYREWAYTEQALARAALMECLGRAAGRREIEAMFLTGLFSLLDQLLGEPLPVLVGKIQLPQDAAAALVDRKGPLAPFLALAEACEADDSAAIAAAAAQLGLSDADVNRAVFSALSRAGELVELASD